MNYLTRANSGFKKITQKYFLTILVATIVACQNRGTDKLATATLMPTTTISTTEDTTPTPSSYPQFQLENLRMAYAIDGDLYIQDGSAQSKFLIETGKDHPSPVFSDDGEKIIFYRGEWGRYSINTDGSQMIPLGITTGWHTFISNTHHVLLNIAYPCQTKQNGTSEVCSTNFFLVNTDTAEFKGILTDVFDGGFYPRENFKISPDGKMISIAKNGSIDIYNINGDIVSSKISEYIITSPQELAPIQYWTSNSKELVLILPTDEYAGPKQLNPNYSVWHYTFNKSAVQVSFDNIQPLFSTYGCYGNNFVSPDGIWMLYYRDPHLYLGNLHENYTNLYADGCTWVVSWSPDSKHFIYRVDLTQYFLGSINNSPIPINVGGFIDWIDETHYIYSNKKDDGRTEFFVGEINKGEILEYKTNIFLPKNATDATFVIRENSNKK